MQPQQPQQNNTNQPQQPQQNFSGFDFTNNSLPQNKESKINKVV